MGLYRKFVSQTRKPAGFLGKMMINGMNSGHAKMAAWGLAHINSIHPRNIVELGCGGGRNVAALLKKYQDAKVTGIDYSPLSVQTTADFNKAAIAAGRCKVQEGDVSALDIGEDVFDLATAFETIYFWPGLEKCFAQVAKVLKPGGYFMIVNESDGTDEVSLKYEKIIDGMKNHTVEEINNRRTESCRVLRRQVRSSQQQTMDNGACEEVILFFLHSLFTDTTCYRK